MSPPLLLLTLPGRKSGALYTVPIAYFGHHGGYIVVGTGMGGSRETPQWLLNLEVSGQGHIRAREREYDVDARLISGAEQDELWPQIAAQAPRFAKWRARTGRTLPLVVLTVRSLVRLRQGAKPPAQSPDNPSADGSANETARCGGNVADKPETASDSPPRAARYTSFWGTPRPIGGAFCER